MSTLLKQNKNGAKARTIAPNNALYVSLLLVAILLTGIALLFRENATVFTIWTGVSCGGIASILVAWLIDAANCRQTSRKTLENRKALFANFYHVFDNGLQLLILESAQINRCIDSKKWYEWIDVSFEQAKDNPEQMRTFIRVLIIFFDDLAEQVFAIKGQEAMLLDSGIIYQEDIQALSTMIKICDTSRATYRSKDSDQECFQRIKTNCGLIRGLIDYAPSLRPINDIMVEPRLYRLYLEAEKESHQSENSHDCLLDDQNKKSIDIEAEDKSIE